VLIPDELVWLLVWFPLVVGILAAPAMAALSNKFRIVQPFVIALGLVPFVVFLAMAVILPLFGDLGPISPAQVVLLVLITLPNYLVCAAIAIIALNAIESATWRSQVLLSGPMLAVHLAGIYWAMRLGVLGT